MVRRLIHTSALAIVAVVLSVGVVAAKEFAFANSSPWHIYVFYKDSGAFGHCGMRTGSKVGSEMLTLLVGEHGYSVFIDDLSWDLPTGTAYPSVTVIDGMKWSGNAVVYMKSGVMMRFNFDSRFGEYFAAGQQMHFSVGQFGRTLNLTGSRRALNYLSACLDQHMPSLNPFGNAQRTDNPFR